MPLLDVSSADRLHGLTADSVAAVGGALATCNNPGSSSGDSLVFLGSPDSCFVGDQGSRLGASLRQYSQLVNLDI